MNATIAYHASQEQFSPSHLLALVKMAGSAGFGAIHSSDHFHPWSSRQGQSGFTFSWIAAAMQTTSLPFSMVCAPGQRYHPAIVAQAIATIGEMFPARFSIELGSGEAINETITGTGWPEKSIRNQRLQESADVIRRLLAGEEVSHKGTVLIDKAKLYSLPDPVPLLFCAAISAETSAWCGEWADGLITTGGDVEEVRDKFHRFRKKAGAEKPVFVQHAFSYHPDREKAIAGAHEQWRTTLIPKEKLADLHTVSDFDREGENITPQEIGEKIDIITSPQELWQRVEQYDRIGADRVILHNVNREQELFISDFGNLLKERLRN